MAVDMYGSEGHFNLPSLERTSEEAQEFMASMTALGLSQAIHGPSQDCGLTLEMIFL